MKVKRKQSSDGGSKMHKYATLDSYFAIKDSHDLKEDPLSLLGKRSSCSPDIGFLKASLPKTGLPDESTNMFLDMEDDSHQSLRMSESNLNLSFSNECSIDEKPEDSLSVIKPLSLFKCSSSYPELVQDSNIWQINIIELEKIGIDFRMRASMLDWMYEVGSQFVLRRDTIQSAIIITDLYISSGLQQEFEAKNLQLLALTSMYIASKLEEVYAPTAENYLFISSNAFTLEELRKVELDICRALKWKLMFVTPNKIFGFLSQEWDSYILNNSSKLSGVDSSQLLFRSKSPSSYRLFCEASQSIDCLICMENTHSLDKGVLVLATMWRVIWNRIKPSGPFLKEREMIEWNRLRAVFVDFVSLHDAIDSITEIEKVAQKYKILENLEFNYASPVDMIKNGQFVVEDSFEDFLSLQCYNRKIASFLAAFYKKVPNS